MKKGLAAAAIAVVVLAAAAYFMISPPKLLSLADGIAGGGRGTERVASGVPFGAHGQRLDVWAPAEGAGKGAKRPVLIWWHGGGWVKGDRDAYAFAARAFASRGFVVVVPDYRKVPGVRFPAFLQDGAEAVRWTHDNVARFGGDPDRVAFAGHSAGAHTAVMLALDTRWLKAAGVDPAIVKAAIGLSGPYDFYPFDKKRSIDAMSHWPRPLETQPIHFARADAPPLLLVTSTADTQVRPKNAINLAARLDSLGAPVVLKNYPGLSHEDVVMALSKPFRRKLPCSRIAWRSWLPTTEADEAMTYTLITANRNYSSWSLRPWVLMKALGIAFEDQLEPFTKPSNWAEFRAFSPTGQVPVLIDGSRTVWDSLGIALYLAERHEGIWPADEVARAFAQCAVCEMHGGFAALRKDCTMNVGVRVEPRPASAALTRDVARIREIFEEGLDRFGGPWLAGPAFTALDAFYAPVAFRIRTYGLDIGQGQAWVERVLAHPAMREWEEQALAEDWREASHEAELVAAGRITADHRR